MCTNEWPLSSPLHTRCTDKSLYIVVCVVYTLCALDWGTLDSGLQFPALFSIWYKRHSRLACSSLFCCRVPSFSYLPLTHSVSLCLSPSHSRITRDFLRKILYPCNKPSLYCATRVYIYARARAIEKGVYGHKKREALFLHSLFLFPSFRVIITMHFFNCSLVEKTRSPHCTHAYSDK